MLKDNEEVADVEKLSHHEFDLDMEEQTRLQAEEDTEVSKVSALVFSVHLAFSSTFSDP
jgi:hypothetical protein